MSIEKINFGYPRGSLQSVYTTEEMTALELAAKTSKKVDECVELVNGVEQSAIEATAVVDEMRIAQDQFMTENNDIRQQLVIDNQDFIETLETSKIAFEADMTTALTTFEGDLNTSKIAFETNMTNAVNTIIANSETTIQTDVDAKIDALVADGTIETILDGQVDAVNTSLTNHIAVEASTSQDGHVQLQTTIDTSETTALTPKGLKNHIDNFLNPHVRTTTLTYYVKPTGDNSNDGLTSETAFQTIQKAVDSIPLICKADVVIEIAAGVYNESIRMLFRAANSITFNGVLDTGNIPLTIMDGTGLGASGIAISASQCACTIYVKNIKAQNFGLAGFEAAYGTFVNCSYCHAVNNGANGFRVYHAVGSFDNGMIDGNNIAGATGATAFHAYMSITNTEIKNSASYAGYYANHSDGHYDNNDVHNCFCGLAARVGGYPNGDGTTFTDCTTGIYQQLGGGAYMSNTTFTNCVKNVDIDTDQLNIKGLYNNEPLYLGGAYYWLYNSKTYMKVTPFGTLPSSATDGIVVGSQMTGTWNSEPLRLGVNYLWIDATGKLRIKSTSPTSDTDGTIVGTQA